MTLRLFFQDFRDGQPLPNGVMGDATTHVFAEVVTHHRVEDASIVASESVFRKWFLIILDPYSAPGFVFHSITAAFWKQVVFETFLSRLTPNTINALNAKQMCLVLWLPEEVYDIYTPAFFEAWERMLTAYGCEPITLLISGDLNTEAHVRAVMGSDPVSPLCRSLNVFEAAPHYQSQLGEEIEPYLSRPRHRHFVCLNRGGRSHRICLVSELIRLDLLRFGHATLLGAYQRPPPSALDPMTNFEAAMSADLRLDEDYAGAGVIPNEVHDAFVNIVTETLFDEHWRGHRPLFVTEKTYKAIYCCQPFLIVGPPGILAYLRSCGYETFPELFDETYDSITDPVGRMRHVVREIEKLCQRPLTEVQALYESFIPRLRRNRELLLSNSLPKSIEKLICELEKTTEIS